MFLYLLFNMRIILGHWLKLNDEASLMHYRFYYFLLFYISIPLDFASAFNKMLLGTSSGEPIVIPTQFFLMHCFLFSLLTLFVLFVRLLVV